MVSGRTILLLAVLTVLTACVTPLMPSQDGEGSCYVIFDANGGTPQKQVAIANEGSTVFPAPAPVRDGYLFVGWVYEPDGPLIDYIVVKGDVTVYAVWMDEVDADEYWQSTYHQIDGKEQYLTPLGYAIKYSPYALIAVGIAVCAILFYTKYRY